MWDNKRQIGLRQALKPRSFGVGVPSGITGVLAKMFRNIVHELGVGPSQWDHFMDQYLNKELKILEDRRRERLIRQGGVETREQIDTNRRDRTSLRGNLNKEFKRKIMTWKVFCKGMRFLQFEGFEFKIIGKRKNGTISTHSMYISFDDVTHEIEQPDDPEEGGEGDAVMSAAGDVLINTDKGDLVEEVPEVISPGNRQQDLFEDSGDQDDLADN
jgi:hypothetical protein